MKTVSQLVFAFVARSGDLTLYDDSGYVALAVPLTLTGESP